MTRRLCTICARGGSKGVPNKNVRLFMGKPLIAHSIAQARASGLFERIAVSTDSPEIAAAAKAAGADDLVERPPEMATDTAAKAPAIRHALVTVERRHSVTFDVLVDLDATAPLRLPDDIKGAVALLESSGAASVVTGCAARRSPYFNLVELQPDGGVKLVKTPAQAYARRQDVPTCYDMNASIYVWRADIFRKDPRVFYDGTRLYEMPAERSREIDTPFDFELVEFMMVRNSPETATTHRRGRFDLTGKVAAVTGGAGILGRQFAAGLAEHGAAVALLDIDGAVEDAARDIGARLGARVLGVPCDIRIEAAVRQAVERIEAELGAIDVLVNNAASKGADLAAFFEPAETYGLETWREVMAVNVDAMFLVAREIGGRMAARQNGSIIQLASIYGVVAPDPRIYEGSEYRGQAINTPPVYSASKAAVIGLTRHLAALWGPRNVRVNALTPGGVESGQNEVFKKKYGAGVPLGRMARADEMVGALVFLASDASSYVTGQNIIVDGGRTAW